MRMTTRWAAAAFAVLSLAADASAQVTSQVVIPRWTVQSVLFVDTDTGDPLDDMFYGGEPYNAAVTPDGRLAVVTQRAGNTISVIDMVSRMVLAKLDGGLEPRGVAIDPLGRFAYVTVARMNLVYVIDLTTLTRVATIPTQSYPWGITLFPDGSKAVVVNRQSNSVSVINLATRTTIINVPGIGQEPVEAVVAPNGRMIYVSSSLTNSIVPIDYLAGAVHTPIPVGDFPVTLAITPNGREVYACNTEGTTISIIDTLSQQVVGSVDIGANTGPYGIAISPDGRFAWVATEGVRQPDGVWSGQLFRINTATRTIMSALPIGGQGLRLALSPNVIVPVGGLRIWR
jgi:YVTN family beta-propeller protein